MWLHSTWTDAFATAASFSRRHSRGFVQQASPLLFRCACSPRLYSPGATSGWSVLLVCLVGLVCLIGLVYLLVCLLVGLLVWLVWCLGSVGLVCLDEVWTGGWSVWLAWSVYCCVCRPVGLGHDRRDSWRFSN